MTLKKTADENGLVLVLSGRAQVLEADEAARSLGEILKTKPKTVTLDLEPLETADVTFFQLILGFRQSLADQGQTLVIKPLPADHPVLETAGLLGISLGGRL